MNELYWIITLGNVSSICTGVTVVITIILCLAVIAVVLSASGDDLDENGVVRILKYFKKHLLIPYIILVLLANFLPTKKELLLIYGVGSVIDFVQESPTAKQLPEKTLKCLDAWCDNFIEEQKEKK